MSTMTHAALTISSGGSLGLVGTNTEPHDSDPPAFRESRGCGACSAEVTLLEAR